MSPAELSMGNRIDLHVERDHDRGLTIATFRCRCGWWTRTSAQKLLVPERVRDHGRVCPHAQPDQLAIDDVLGGES